VEEAWEAALEVAQEEITAPKGLSQARQAVMITSGRDRVEGRCV